MLGPGCRAVGVCLVLAAGLCFGGTHRPLIAGEPPARAQGQANLDAVLAAYLSGDVAVVPTTFARSRDFQDLLRLNEPKVLDRWLGSWHRGKAVLLLDLAGHAVRVAPQYTAVLALTGERFLERSRSQMSAEDAAFIRLWHRSAIAWMERIGNPLPIEEYLDAIGAVPRGGRTANPADARLVLAYAIAQEQRCWTIRPIDQPGSDADGLGKDAGMAVRADLDLPKRSRRLEADAHLACLAIAEARYASALAVPEVRAEAGARGGWVRYQQQRIEPARQWLAAVDPAGDRELTYWTGLFRGRVADALGQPSTAEAAYRSALAAYPAAQSASIGLALALVRLDRDAEADAVARALRAAPNAPDPWSTYIQGDHRFVDRWMAELRRAAQ